MKIMPVMQAIPQTQTQQTAQPQKTVGNKKAAFGDVRALVDARQKPKQLENAFQKLRKSELVKKYVTEPGELLAKYFTGSQSLNLDVQEKMISGKFKTDTDYIEFCYSQLHGLLGISFVSKDKAREQEFLKDINNYFTKFLPKNTKSTKPNPNRSKIEHIDKQYTGNEFSDIEQSTKNNAFFNQIATGELD